MVNRLLRQRTHLVRLTRRNISPTRIRFLILRFLINRHHTSTATSSRRHSSHRYRPRLRVVILTKRHQRVTSKRRRNRYHRTNRVRTSSTNTRRRTNNMFRRLVGRPTTVTRVTKGRRHNRTNASNSSGQRSRRYKIMVENNHQTRHNRTSMVRNHSTRTSPRHHTRRLPRYRIEVTRHIRHRPQHHRHRSRQRRNSQRLMVSFGQCLRHRRTSRVRNPSTTHRTPNASPTPRSLQTQLFSVTGTFNRIRHNRANHTHRSVNRRRRGQIIHTIRGRLAAFQRLNGRLRAGPLR